jgi:hypothetical protein
LLCTGGKSYQREKELRQSVRGDGVHQTGRIARFYRYISKNAFVRMKEKKLKDFIAESLVGKSARFVCNCTAHIDISGTVVGYTVLSNEILFKVQTQDGKLYEIGENHPNMNVIPL